MRYTTILPLAAVALYPTFAAPEPAAGVPRVAFYDVSSLTGLVSPPNWKYGGPCVADFTGDGRYDFMLGNHDKTPIQFFTASEDGRYTEQTAPLWRGDVHGLAAGDYDRDGDNDLLVSLGGGNGTTPQPPRLLRNDGGKFTDVTQDAGIADLGARGRSVRWIDLDSDGDLDMLQINAKQANGEQGPRNILFENNGDGMFKYRPCPELEQFDAEKVFVTDFDGDGAVDIVTFSPWAPVTFWRGDNGFGLTSVNESWLPDDLRNTIGVAAVAEADIDNDGDMDYYLARGGKINQQVLHYDSDKRRLDLCSEGHAGRRAISFTTEPWATGIDLLKFTGHSSRGPYRELPLFIGKDKSRRPAPDLVKWIGKAEAEGFPEKLEENGWDIGHLGDNRWRLEWMLDDWLAWSVRATIIHVKEYEPDFETGSPDLPDILLRNDGGGFTDLSGELPDPAGDNNRGVVPGGFNNDGYIDFFVYRFGKLSQRLPDAMLMNLGNNSFAARLDHGATNLSGGSHGDMGSAFDHNGDGWLDILSGDGGDTDKGSWHLYQNTGGESPNSNYLTVRVGYSETGIDPIAAEVKVTTSAGTTLKRVGSGGAAFTQSLLDVQHFGVGSHQSMERVAVRWRDGSEVRFDDVAANQILTVGRAGLANTVSPNEPD